MLECTKIVPKFEKISVEGQSTALYTPRGKNWVTLHYTAKKEFHAFRPKFEAGRDQQHRKGLFHAAGPLQDHWY